MRNVNKLEGVLKNIWCDWSPCGAFINFKINIISCFYWFNTIYLFIIII